MSTLTLARWLGPWADAQKQPAVQREERTLSCGLRLRIWQPERPRGSLLLVPGFHYLGPAEPRLDRFAAILAAAGIQVHAPYLPAFLGLRLAPTLIDDTRRAFDDLVASERPAGKPGVLSISFGSLPALRLAAERGGDLGGLLVFGGYADWRASLAFAVGGGQGGVEPDPLNRPLVFSNLLDEWPERPAGAEALHTAWRAFMFQTWGREAMRDPLNWRAAAWALEARLPEALRPLFRVGCSLDEGGAALAQRMLDHASLRPWLDPRPHLGAIDCPTFVVHGADDDVIPVSEAEALASGIPGAQRLVTGLYGHTATAGLGAGLGEAKTMRRILAAIRQVGGLSGSGRGAGR